MHPLQKHAPEDIDDESLPFDDSERLQPAHLSANYRSKTLPGRLMQLHASKGNIASH